MSQKPFAIVCLGDSITCNWNEKSYVDYWQQLFDKQKESVNVIGAGINGETAQDGYYRLDRDVITYQPDLVTIMFGHNDADPPRNISPVLFANYLRKIVNYLQHNSNANIWLLTPNQLGDEQYNQRYEPYVKMIKQACTDKKVHFVDLFTVFSDQNLDEIFTYSIASSYIRGSGKDWIHPNQRGQELIAQKLLIEFKAQFDQTK